jgi:hypothetical protein
MAAMNDIMQFVPLLTVTILTAIPCWVLLGKIGFLRWWLLFLILPMIGWIALLWIVAFRRWPTAGAAS